LNDTLTATKPGYLLGVDADPKTIISFTQLVVEELFDDWEELRQRSFYTYKADVPRREVRLITPEELKSWMLDFYGFDDIDSYYANGYGFIDTIQTVALRTAIESIDWAEVIKQLEEVNGGKCFACEAKADDDHWWEVNREAVCAGSYLD